MGTLGNNLASACDLLIVDDMPANLRLLSSMLTTHGYKVRAVISGAMALTAVHTAPPDLILLDISMPEMDGYQVCAQLKADPTTCNIPIIFISALDDVQDKVKALSSGGVDYITKPFHIEEVLARVRTHTSLRSLQKELQDANQQLEGWNHVLEERVRQRTEELEQAYITTLEGWARALELRDYETSGHSQRVTQLAVCLGHKMGIQGEDIIHLQRGALLHDIGKMGIPDQIMLKPGKLDEKEWEIMRLHPNFAYEMLSAITFLQPALDIPYCHHEKWDGTGYPRGLKGTEIPLAARIFSVVDVWDALSSDRPYRKAWEKNRVLEYLQQNTGTDFDPAIVEQFFLCIQ
jgi:putative two-component system response regulator